MDLAQLFTITDYRTMTINIPCFQKETPTSISEEEKEKNDDGKHSSSDSLSIQLASSPAASTDYDLTGQILWPVSYLLAYYLASHVGQSQMRNRHVVELGAGCGLAGLVSAHFSKKVIVSDGNEIVVDLLEQNVANFLAASSDHENISARQLTWGDRAQCDNLLESMQGHVDVVVAADVVQWPSVVEPLLHTVKHLLWTSTSEAPPTMILGIVNRAQSCHDLFFRLAKDLGFSATKISPFLYLKEGILPASCKEYGGRETELYQVILVDKSQPPILLKQDILLGQSYENNAFLPC